MSQSDIIDHLKDSSRVLAELRGCLDLAYLQERIAKTQEIIDDPDGWKSPAKVKAATSENKQVCHLIYTLDDLTDRIEIAEGLYEMAVEDADAAMLKQLSAEAKKIHDQSHELQVQRFFQGKNDASAAYIDIQAGSGGTEAQDWAQMLYRMYVRWAEKHNFEVHITQMMDGDVAGIRNATVLISGPYAYGWLRTESGVHRLVRKSPFDSGNKRHTSFASVFIYPEVDDVEAEAINPADLRVDTYRASGAGGQHVNTTDSAVRITHLPTGVVVQCQAERSQHKNKASALKQLSAKLYQIAQEKQQEEKQVLEENKDDITWGQQIRSYVLDQSRIKDLRTGVEVGHTQSVLDGDLDVFIKASLQQDVSQSD
ncbi:peptide chain release factor 2 [Gammaproteobacteria bacterium]|nr:peptide chain release factor 2 [Gammaproteobacteria bacterium]